MILLDLQGRTEKTHISTYEQDIWEVNTLHEGKYREALKGTLNDFEEVE